MTNAQETILSLLAIVIVGIAMVLGIGAVQSYLTDPARGCTRYDASADYWGYNCTNKTGFYVEK